MLDRGRWSFLVPAAGDGLRAGMGPKAWLEIAGRTLLEWVVDVAVQVSDDIIVALPPDTKVDKRGPDCRYITGGSSRQDTVRVLLDQSDRDWIVLHDVARPFVSVDLINAVIEAALVSGAAVTVNPIDVPVAIVADERLVDQHAAKDAGLVQTPIALRRDILQSALDSALRSGLQARSTVEVLHWAGAAVRAVPGDRNNIKITHPEDVAHARLIAEQILTMR